MNVEIDLFRPEHSRRFAELNREWLTKYNLMEPSDEEQLADPQAHFLADGGQIFVALHAGEVIGTPGCASIVRFVRIQVLRGTGSPCVYERRCLYGTELDIATQVRADDGAAAET
jgi:hypothetical protein